MHKPTTLVILGFALLSGCTLAPRYERPAAPVSKAWPTSAMGSVATARAGATSPSAADLGWRDFFADPRLQQLVDLSLTNNRDLRVALLNVERSRAQYRIQRSDMFPSVDAMGSGARQRSPADLSPTGQALTASQYSVGLGVTAFELDLFGRVRSLTQQALEQYLATEEARRSAQLALVAAVATQYLTERAYDEQLVLARQTYETVQASLELTRRRFEQGSANELDVRTAEAQVQTARSNVASYVQLRAQAENALVVLVGQPLPAVLPAPRSLEAQALVAELPSGLPSDLLQRRPDIRQAEHTLRSANANIGASRAAFFPSISLTASGGTSSAELSGLFKNASGTWLFSPQINLPIFSGGRNRANLDVANVTKQIEVANYEKAIQIAFREVADALAARSTLDEQIAAQAARVAAEQKRFALTELRYRTGVDNYLVVLLAQQDLYSAQQTLIQSQLSRLSNYIALYKALGGGLQPRSRLTSSSDVAEHKTSS